MIFKFIDIEMLRTFRRETPDAVVIKLSEHMLYLKDKGIFETLSYECEIKL